MFFEIKPRNRYIEVKAKGREGIVIFPTYVPGSYVIRELERNIVEIDGIRISKNRFFVKDSFTYLVYASSFDQRETISTTDYLFINPPAVFPFQEKEEKYCVKIDLPESWKIATSLYREGDMFCANNYDDFADSPIEASPNLKILKIDESHVVSTIDDINTENLRKIVREADSILGNPANYVFHFRRSSSNFGGIEHKNSSAIVVSWNRKNLETLFAHEYFHRWNVKRLIPSDLIHNYEREVYTELLWFAEGFTDYMAVEISRRAEVIDNNTALKSICNSLSMLTFPGSKRVSLAEASKTAWIKYYKQDENFLNSSVSYYDGGLSLAYYVDLELNKKGEKIDVLFKQLPNRYTFDDINNILKKYGLDIEDLVYSPAVEIFNAIKDVVNLELVDKGKPYYGLRLSEDNVINFIEDYSPADEAGLLPKDKILGLNGKPIIEVKEEESVITVSREGRIKEYKIKPSPNPGHKVKITTTNNILTANSKKENVEAIADIEIL
ncbi:M61 family peptidase [Acidianus sulfidivorans JP7]|uniref:Peptidase M61 n=1 Tax=Acidianus sulfidivorans JP7 TaxID=619593 RepID=A0A2U9IL32_9CREN|nr:M61 family metallopeptidase [Acidianus sulfidivorans]AWR96721.1 M61 family peptidase [Acidianus sulfidivorans JP7]